MSPPLISIIVPIYKVEPYLRRCLDSIVNQTYTNLEIILIDDGSPDGCPQICDEYAAKDTRIVVIHKENGGLSDARNAGLDICKGDFISFIDSDDWVEKNYISTLQALFSDDIDIAVGNFQQFSEDGRFFSPEKQAEGIFSSRELLDDIFSKTTPYKLAWGKLFRKKLFQTIRFPFGKVHEDEFTGYKPYCFSNSVACTNKVLYHYLRRPDSITGKEIFFDKTEIVESQMFYLYNIGLNEHASKLASKLSWEWLNRFWLASTKRTKLFSSQECLEKISFLLCFLEKNSLIINLNMSFFSFFSKHPQIYLFYKKIFAFLPQNRKRNVNLITLKNP